jgi:hypothetical protein
MKKLNKFQINSDKLLKNDELLVLKGADGGGACCFCYANFTNQGAIASYSVWDCADICNYIWPYNPQHGNYSSWECIE